MQTGLNSILCLPNSIHSFIIGSKAKFFNSELRISWNYVTVLEFTWFKKGETTENVEILQKQASEAAGELASHCFYSTYVASSAKLNLSQFSTLI